ncbi:hypothetical protein [Agrobacterium pusense]|uniref:hypothetical protein n=1 Tax=Agrobacterium pusense TaxID=648995 RepID=UPI00384E69D7
MADPTKFVPGFDYSDFEQSNPTLPKPGAQLDNDFANIKQTTDQTIEALKQIRRSDGALKNGIVTADSLSPGLIIGIETPQAWQTGVTYRPPDAVFISSGVNQGIYRATITHVSTTFAADLAAGKWELIFNLAAAGLSTVALTGEYADLLNKPVLGTAAATDADEYATAAQGGRADSAVQPEDLADVATSGEYGDLNGKPFTVPAGGATGQTLIKTSGADGAYVWQNPPGGGDMLASLYDPQSIEGDAFDRANHTGEQAIDTITGLPDALDGVDTALAKRVRVDAVQVFSEAEKGRGRANIDGSSLSGFRDKVINGNGLQVQRTFTTVADDVYWCDRHYVLTQTAAITPTVIADVSNDLSSMMRLTQTQAVAQRMGNAQIVEAAVAKRLRGQKVTLGGKLRFSSGQTVRFALLEWTGTADAVVSDVVANWASGSFTAGNFFLGTNLTVAAVGAITPAANTVTDWSLVADVSGACNNLIAFYWTEGTAAQNATLDMVWGLVEGDASAELWPYQIRGPQEEFALCQRYYEVVIGGFSGACTNGVQYVDVIRPVVKKRATPTLTWRAGQAVFRFNNAAPSIIGVTPDGGVTVGMTATSTGDGAYSFHSFNLDAEL